MAWFSLKVFKSIECFMYVFCNLAPNNEYLPIDYGEKKIDTVKQSYDRWGLCWDSRLFWMGYYFGAYCLRAGYIFYSFFRWTGLFDSLADYAGSQKRIIEEQACINRHTSCKYLGFPRANRMFCGAETYVFHAGNVSFRLVKRKKPASILKKMLAGFYWDFSKLFQ